ncbi:MAG: 2-amino-4-hydroxy-6-hydroxymethyldihydropteridine diphosphokinase, partial [Spirochaetales bacterium]|nr:2-amino-4-hydroxy-6-hydroxymethyldihydropteridine diphosphokinase [Spirochaetales bacterium]
MIYISLGSNLGDRKENLDFALKELKEICSGVRISSLYLTAALEDTDQPDFLNAVVECEKGPEPEKLLELLLLIEQKTGRIREKKRRYGPRTLDMDIILYHSRIIRTETLVIPHPRMNERAFVLYPLLELNNKLVHPATKIKI